MSGKRSSAAALASIALFSASVVRAAVPTPEARVLLTWNAPQGCPSQAEVESLLTKALAIGSNPPSETARVRADVTNAADGSWVLELSIENAHGTRHRQLTHQASCAPLAKAASVVIAIALDPSAAQSDDQSPPSPAPTPQPAPTAPSVPREPSTSRALRAGLRLQLGGAVGQLPRAGPVLGGVTALVFPALRFEGTFVYSPKQRASVPSLTTSGADFGLWAAGLRFCPSLRLTTEMELLLCAGGELGQLRAAAVGLEVPRAVNGLWVAPVFAPALHWPRSGQWSGVFGAELSVPLKRTEFVIEDAGVVHRPFVVGLRILVGLELELP